MCEHCGCRGVEPIANLMDEHFSLLELSGRLRRAIDGGDRAAAAATLALLVDELTPHVWVEEHGLFTAMRAAGDFVEHVDELEREHLDLDATLAGLDPGDPDWDEEVLTALDVLEEHIAKENLGLFPAAVVTLGVNGWATVTAAAERRPAGTGRRSEGPARATATR